jgi:hypothetical protein
VEYELEGEMSIVPVYSRCSSTEYLYRNRWKTGSESKVKITHYWCLKVHLAVSLGEKANPGL